MKIFEPRLSALLKVNRFHKPPDYRHVRKGADAPPNASLRIPALRFPRWYRHTRTGDMKRFNLNTFRVEIPSDGGRWQPVRFLSVCSSGHLNEFPWKEWIGCNCPDDGNLVLTDKGGSELTSVRVHCKSCPKNSKGNNGRHLGNTTVNPKRDTNDQSAFEKAGIQCPGGRPWLGENSHEQGCGSPLVGALINQTNLYFARTVSALTLPIIEIQDESVSKLMLEIEADSSNLGVAKTLWEMKSYDGACALIKDGLSKRHINFSDDDLKEALGVLFDTADAYSTSTAANPIDPERELLSFRRQEYNIIRNEINDSAKVPDLRVLTTEVSNELNRWFSRVNLVEQLCETKVFYGFDRLVQNRDPLMNTPEPAMRQLFLDPPTQRQDRWLPATKVFGEGIYLELNENTLREWQSNNSKWLEKRLNEQFLNRLEMVQQTLPPLTGITRQWASRYLVVHSLAHVLINQLVFESGYSTASLRERIYVSDDVSAPMAAILIYTAAGDSDGTLGGLVRLGRKDRLGAIVERAISRASWCSADPVCSENYGGQGSMLVNLAACHACTLLPETSCETINHGLDRAVLVGTPEERASGIFSDMVEKIYTTSYQATN